LERLEATEKLKSLVGLDLRPLADTHQVTVWKDGKKNKGWAEHTLERFLGLPINSAQSPNFGSWELKGPGHGSKSRAFYARAPFVARILGDGYHIPLPVVAK